MQHKHLTSSSSADCLIRHFRNTRLNLLPMSQNHTIQTNSITLQHWLRVQVIHTTNILPKCLDLTRLHPLLALTQLTPKFDSFVILTRRNLHLALTRNNIFQSGERLEENSPHISIVYIRIHGERSFSLCVADSIATKEINLSKHLLFLLLGLRLLHLIDRRKLLHMRYLWLLLAFGWSASTSRFDTIRLHVHIIGLLLRITHHVSLHIIWLS